MMTIFWRFVLNYLEQELQMYAKASEKRSGSLLVWAGNALSEAARGKPAYDETLAQKKREFTKTVISALKATHQGSEDNGQSEEQKMMALQDIIKRGRPDITGDAKIFWALTYKNPGDKNEKGFLPILEDKNDTFAEASRVSNDGAFGKLVAKMTQRVEKFYEHCLALSLLDVQIPGGQKPEREKLDIMTQFKFELALYIAAHVLVHQSLDDKTNELFIVRMNAIKATLPQGMAEYDTLKAQGAQNDSRLKAKLVLMIRAIQGENSACTQNVNNRSGISVPFDVVRFLSFEVDFSRATNVGLGSLDSALNSLLEKITGLDPKLLTNPGNIHRWIQRMQREAPDPDKKDLRLFDPNKGKGPEDDSQDEQTAPSLAAT